MILIFVVLVACAAVWAVWGFAPALVVFGLFGLWGAVAVYNGPRMAARNAAYAALTCRDMDFGQLGKIDAGVTRICQRMGIDSLKLGPPFPLGGPLTLLNHPASVFSLRALAMHELGIPPVGTKVAKWFIVRNPFWAGGAQRSIRRYKKKILEDFGVDLTELDRESYEEDE